MPSPNASPPRRFAALVLVGGLVVLSGCGAMVAKTRYIGADVAIRAAERAGAERKATYDFVAAQVFFEKAREEESKARYGFAIDYYGEAEARAEKAKVKALASDAESAPTGPPPTPNR